MARASKTGQAMLQQQNKAHWYDNPLIAQDASMLSTECVDLLNRMFHLDEQQR